MTLATNATGLWSYWMSPAPATTEQADRLLQLETQGLAQGKETLELLKRLQQIAELKREEFHREYPLGYALFFAHETEIHQVHTLTPGITIDWREVRLLDLKAGRVIIRVPDVSLDLPGLERVSYVAMNFELPTRVGSGGTFNLGGGYWLAYEVIEVDGRGLVFLIGASRKSS